MRSSPSAQPPQPTTDSRPPSGPRMSWRTWRVYGAPGALHSVRGLRPLGSGELGSLVCCAVAIAFQSISFAFKAKLTGSHGSRGKEARMSLRLRVRFSELLSTLLVAVATGSLLVTPPA